MAESSNKRGLALHWYELMIEMAFSFVVDLGNGLPKVNYIPENKRFFSDYYIIDNVEYQTILKEALLDYRIMSMMKNPNGFNQLDIMRVWLLMKNPSSIYIDCDCKILKEPFGYFKSLPAFGQTSGHLDFFLIVGNGNGNRNYFDEILTIMHHKHPTECFPILDAIPGWYRNFINPECYKHDAITSTEARKTYLKTRHQSQLLGPKLYGL